MIWYILLILFVVFLVWLLMGPVIVFVNTSTNRYFLTLPGVIRAAVVPTDELFHIRGWIFFVPFKFSPFRKRTKKIKKGPGTPDKKRKFKLPSGGIGMARDVVGSVRIKKLELDIDTDDFMLNAWLVPVFSMVNGENARLRVNFEGSSSLLLDMRIRLGALLWVFIRNRYKSFF
jgi:hypothetical protein